MPDIHARFGMSPEATSELRFAADLASRLGARLFVWIDEDPAARLLAGADLGPARREETEIRDRIGLLIGDMFIGGRLALRELRFARGNPADCVHQPDAIIVGRRFTRAGLRPMTVAPMGEASIEARGSGSVCIPFGNGESALRAASSVLPLAAALKMPVVLYHTTWKESDVPSTAAPHMHMCREADAVLKAIRSEADAADVAHRTIIETANNLVEGIGKIALAEHCALIATARGAHTGRGSYVKGLLRRTPVPVLVAGRSA